MNSKQPTNVTAGKRRSRLPGKEKQKPRVSGLSEREHHDPGASGAATGAPQGTAWTVEELGVMRPLPLLAKRLKAHLAVGKTEHGGGNAV